MLLCIDAWSISTSIGTHGYATPPGDRPLPSMDSDYEISSAEDIDHAHLIGGVIIDAKCLPTLGIKYALSDSG